jgi:putative lipoic acid-binding regulatory protein
VTEQEPPRIEFPCDYPIKVLGRHSSDFRAVVVEVMRKHAGNIADSQVKERPSGKGTFVSVTVTITATGKDQIDAIFFDLKATGRVQMVL